MDGLQKVQVVAPSNLRVKGRETRESASAGGIAIASREPSRLLANGRWSYSGGVTSLRPHAGKGKFNPGVRYAVRFAPADSRAPRD